LIAQYGQVRIKRGHNRNGRYCVVCL